MAHRPDPDLASYRTVPRNGNRESDDRLTVYDCLMCGGELTPVYERKSKLSDPVLHYRHRKAA
jgi:hypothetical protein